MPCSPWAPRSNEPRFGSWMDVQSQPVATGARSPCMGIWGLRSLELFPHLEEEHFPPSPGGKSRAGGVGACLPRYKATPGTSSICLSAAHRPSPAPQAAEASSSPTAPSCQPGLPCLTGRLLSFGTSDFSTSSLCSGDSPHVFLLPPCAPDSRSADPDCLGDLSWRVIHSRVRPLGRRTRSTSSVPGPPLTAAGGTDT